MALFQKAACLLPAVVLFFSSALFSSCASNAVSAEEYFSIGMAYFELGNYEEAERWLNRARAVDKTMSASEYNLGRIAFAAGRYGDAAVHFENILAWDSENVMALKGAAYSRIKNGDLDKAKALYARVLILVPESADDGYNYALVLYAMEEFDACEDVLKKYDYAMEEDNDALLLFARAQSAGDKPEAADSYAKWIANSKAPNPLVHYEYGKVLENLELFARAVEQFRAGIEAIGNRTDFPQRGDLLFEIGRILLIADPESGEGMEDLRAAREAGFDDREAFEKLHADSRISSNDRESIGRMIDGMEIAAPENEAETPDTEAPEDEAQV